MGMSSQTDVERARQVVERHLRSLEEPIVEAVVGRLRKRRVPLPRPDVEAAYNQAWSGVYETIAKGEEVENLAGLLFKITYMRAIDLYRQRRQHLQIDQPLDELATEIDLAEYIDDQQKINGVLARLNARLTQREQAAVALCLLRGYPRSEVARQLGLNDRKLKKVMDSANKKLAGIVNMMQPRGCGDDEWARALRAYALGLTDNDSRDYSRITDHTKGCPSCKRYIVCLRGLSVIFPPILPFLHDPAVLHPDLHKLLTPVRTTASGGASGSGTAPLVGTAGAGSGSAGASGLLSTLGGGGLVKTAAIAGIVVAGTAGGFTAIKPHHVLVHNPPSRPVFRRINALSPPSTEARRRRVSTDSKRNTKHEDLHVVRRSPAKQRAERTVGIAPARGLVAKSSSGSHRRESNEFSFENTHPHAEPSNSGQAQPSPTAKTPSPPTDEEFGP